MTELYSGFIVVRLGPAIAPPPDVEISDLRALARDRGSIELSRVLDDYSHCATGRLVSSLGPKQIVELEQKAAQRGSAPRRSLSSYWRIDAREINDPDQLVERFIRSTVSRSPIVNYVGQEPQHGDARCCGCDGRQAITHDPHPLASMRALRGHTHMAGGNRWRLLTLKGVGVPSIMRLRPRLCSFPMCHDRSGRNRQTRHGRPRDRCGHVQPSRNRGDRPIASFCQRDLARSTATRKR